MKFKAPYLLKSKEPVVFTDGIYCYVAVNYIDCMALEDNYTKQYIELDGNITVEFENGGVVTAPTNYFIKNAKNPCCLGKFLGYTKKEK